MEEVKDYTGKINLGGLIADYDQQNCMFIGVDRPEIKIPLADFAHSSRQYSGYLSPDYTRVIAAELNQDPGELIHHIPVSFNQNTLEYCGSKHVAAMRFYNTINRVKGKNVLLIDDRLNRALNNLPPLFQFLDREYSYSAFERTLISVDGSNPDILLPELGRIEQDNRISYVFDHATSVAKSYWADEHPQYVLLVPRNPDPFFLDVKGEGEHLPISFRMLSADFHDPSSIAVLETKALQINRKIRREELDTDQKLRIWFADGGFKDQILFGRHMFHADYALKRWVSNEEPANVIPFNAFTLDMKGKAHLALNNVSGTVAEEGRPNNGHYLTHVSMDAKLMSEGIPQDQQALRKINEDPQRKGFYIPDEVFIEQTLLDRLPTLSLDGDLWTVDGTWGYLRNNQKPSLDISQDKIYQKGFDGEHVLLYNRRTKADDMESLETAPEVKPEWTILNFPPLRSMDPVGYARRNGYDILTFITESGMSRHFKAEITPMDRSGVREAIGENRKRLGLPPLREGDENVSKSKRKANNKGI